MAKYDSTEDTKKHKYEVAERMQVIVDEIHKRRHLHDKSKLESPEKEIFDVVTPALKGLTYGSDEYKKQLDDMKVALDHHYKHNRHHPEHFFYHECNGCFSRYDEEPNRCPACGYSQFQKRTDISKMNLVDIIEMLSDWKAATMRHDNGCILKSLEINQERFGYSDDFKKMLLNTVIYLGWET